MDANQVQAITENVSSALVKAGAVAEVLAPQYAAFIVLGQAVAKALPELEADVVRLIQAKNPTDADKQLFAAKIVALANPENL